MKANAKSHTHCQVARKSRPASQNLSISMSFANAEKMLTKLKETERIKKAQGTTKAISNAGKVLNRTL